ncbi:16S rRNA pseudouridine(516) synthase [Alkalihalophilus pseudofirmus]|uniref:pseudouridine synthase n=1 Tax=Alkalihalophilus TaxID=2893060 RepID=UPI00095328AB|nr:MULTISPECIES: pseudouridine synthase [Alkalihalophilus]MED1600193.1 pseudouridine synthase [Alkalihalophilus marmarensis]OLS35315.1 16S rRNA pseudouridine(516) synthase [Alkalihalophilus pseudofirmus]WEG16302.1 pseudouridine synthase [Alkalihalophilus pseudofirmus]
MRLDKLLSNMGYGSRKEVKKVLKNGSVRINEKVIKDGSYKVDPDQSDVTVLGELVEYKPYVYLMLNKPQGVISATEDNHHKTVIDLLDESYLLYDPFPVGRLDKDTEGMLLLTNDGKFSHSLMSPKKHVKKTYYAKVKGTVTEEDIGLFKNGVTLEDGYVTKPADLTIITAGEQSEIELTITEGKFHQVKRMFEAVDKKVTFLKRISIGGLKLDPSLEKGMVRELTEEDKLALFEELI